MRIRKFGWLWKKETRETKKKGGGGVKSKKSLLIVNWWGVSTLIRGVKNSRVYEEGVIDGRIDFHLLSLSFELLW